MSIPKVAIVGRPNVGKSSLLNWLAGKLVSVVDPTAGVTRDRVTYLMHERDRYFELVDTGGMGIEDLDDLTTDVERQIDLALDEADLILFVVDGTTGAVPLDQHVARRLRRVQTPKLLIVNKCDSPRTDDEVHVFYALASESPLIQTSVKANRNRAGLIEAIIEALPAAGENEQETGQQRESDPELKLAIVGRRNVGKSTYINALAECERMIVSEVAGTTRDSVDIQFEGDGKRFVAIDTPGVRKRTSMTHDIEFYGLVRAQKSIRRADVVLMFFDSQETISRVDKQLVSEIDSRTKPCIFVVNKWDLGKDADMEMGKWSEYLQREFPTMKHVPVAFVTAKDGRNVRKLINLAQSVAKQAKERVSTGLLNRVVREAIRQNQPRIVANRRPRVLFATQVATEPPTIVIKCNDPKLFEPRWKRYLLGVLHDELPFREVPIKLYFRGREDEGNDEERSTGIRRRRVRNALTGEEE
ncbi:MAG: ribosome biogenesis GTPase Der [Planctomycetaceae bacterium]